MKKFAAISLAALALSGVANASWFLDDNDKWSEPECWYNPDCNPYDPWDPRYWAEEMDSFWNDDNDEWLYYGRPGFGGPYGPYGPPMAAPYGAPMPYGPRPPMMGPYGPRMPYGAPAPMGPPGAAGAPVPPAAGPYGAAPYGPRPMPMMPNAPRPNYGAP